MNEGLFKTQVNECWKILRKLELEKERVFHPIYPQKPASIFRNLSYIEIWETCIAHQYYDFQLTDNSLIQFRKNSYVYYECPYNSLSYPEFLHEHLETTLYEVGDEFKYEYEDYLSGCEKKESVTPIRYDYDPDRYEQGRHPASHIHFGHNNHIRLATTKILKPLSFFLLIIRQCYPELWITKLLKLPETKIWCKNIREQLDNVNEKFWNPFDEWEMKLS